MVTSKRDESRPSKDPMITMVERKKKVLNTYVYLDKSRLFNLHINVVIEKAENVIEALCKFMGTKSDPLSSKRKVILTAAASVLLYAAPAWEYAFRIKRNVKQISVLFRRTAIKITAAIW